MLQNQKLVVTELVTAEILVRVRRRLHGYKLQVTIYIYIFYIR